jgi:NAD+ kinase/solute carrier family 25 oxoglutarate transporter 11
VVKKPNDKDTTAMLPGVVRILEERKITAWVEPAVHWETGLGRTWTHDEDPRLDRFVDFIVCLGGDGTILWVSNLFPRACPPVISFAMGSLGFLTAFEVESVPEALRSIADGGFFFTQRSRLVARVTLPDGAEERHSARVCLNEVVIDRGASAALIELDVCIDGHPMTKVLADGVMLSTPTGSTAYSLAAGGSMVHPGVSGVLFVPICPHTLSFRPLVLPDTVVLTITVPVTARVEPVASFDGKQQRRLKRGESLVVAGWRFPVPAICKSGETGDWFRAVKDSLLWNVRGAVQKPYGEEKSAT